MRRRRRALATADPEASRRAAAVLPLATLLGFRVVAGYLPIGAEMDPGPVLARFAGAGATIVFPVALAVDRPLVFRERVAAGALIVDAHGAYGPPDWAPRRTPDLVIAPILAFDRAGGRLGQGAGAFDRTLAILRAAGDMFVIGLAFAGQEATHVPLEPHDQRLDAILTEAEYILVR